MEKRRDVFQAIADPTRRDIISLLAGRPLPLNAIADRFHLSRQAISLHIKILTECGLIAVQPQGRERHCSIQADKLAAIDAWLSPFRALWEARFERLDQVLTTIQSTEHAD
ncbi:MAG: helix-turn-helix transcriptional regulator [Saprospiraceae bacterium]|nr:helix-turn-helix transcriptional regulator [Saprospiraceae bacterium]